LDAKIGGVKMDHLIETVSNFFLVQVAKRGAGSESDKFVDVIKSLLPLAIIVFFWLLGRRARTKTPEQQQPPQKTAGTSSYDLFKRDGALPQQPPAGTTPVGSGDVDMDSEIPDISTVQNLPSPYDRKTFGGPPPVTPKPIKPRWWG
jgi:hypothetical protein